MASTVKILGQAALSATTLTDVYTVPASTQTAISSVTICNRAASGTTFRLSVAAAGAADNVKQYILYDTSLPGNEAYIATIGITLATTDVLRVYTPSSSVSVNVFGEELS